MSEFVNYNKREVTLPLGCKNLVDVLSNPVQALPALPAIPDAGTKKPVWRNKSFTAPLSEIGKYVAMAFQSHSPMFNMWFMVPDGQLAVHLTHAQGRVDASVGVQTDTQDEKAVWEFFVYHGLKMPTDFKKPAQFHAGLPWNINYDISPLPPDSFIVSQLLKDLFRYVCALTGKSEIRIHYDEIIDAV